MHVCINACKHVEIREQLVELVFSSHHMDHVVRFFGKGLLSFLNSLICIYLKIHLFIHLGECMCCMQLYSLR